MHQNAQSPASGPDCPFESGFECAVTHKQIAHSGQTEDKAPFCVLKHKFGKMNSPQGEPRRPQKSRESFSAQQIQLTPLIPSLSLSSEKAPQLKDTKHVYELISKQIAWIQKTTNRASTQYETEFSFLVDSLHICAKQGGSK